MLVNVIKTIRRYFLNKIETFFLKRKNRKFKISKISGLNYYLVDYKPKFNLLDDLCVKFPCDKGGLPNKNYYKHYPHNYSEIYNQILFGKRLNFRKILEIGVGSNNSQFFHNMGRKYTPGNSLRVWREYFPNANIFGADIDKSILFKEDRINTFFVDQMNRDSIKNMYDLINEDSFNVIIDDGYHFFEANINLFESSINYLSNDGYYFIEDIHEDEIEKFNNYFSKLDHKYYFYAINNEKHIFNNNLLLICKS
jgi:hypothetical protein